MQHVFRWTSWNTPGCYAQYWSADRALFSVRGQLACKLIVLAAVLLIAGCHTEKESLHELDHEVPPHWPSSIFDTAIKIQERLDALLDGAADSVETGSADSEATIRSELLDLVTWAPEIAADTNLTEQQWIPIYEMSETIRKHLASDDVAISQIGEDFQKLDALLRDAHQILDGSEVDSSDSANANAAEKQSEKE